MRPREVSFYLRRERDSNSQSDFFDDCLLPHTAEAERFELSRAFTLLAFQASALDHYATPPLCAGISMIPEVSENFGRVVKQANTQPRAGKLQPLSASGGSVRLWRIYPHSAELDHLSSREEKGSHRPYAPFLSYLFSPSRLAHSANSDKVNSPTVWCLPKKDDRVIS